MKLKAFSDTTTQLSQPAPPVQWCPQSPARGQWLERTGDLNIEVIRGAEPFDKLLSTKNGRKANM